MMSNTSVLSVRNLSVAFATADGDVIAVDKLSFDLALGETLGIVGESGSGKSVTASSIMRLNNSSSATTTGEILLEGTNILTASEDEVRSIRGKDVAMIFQDPLSALNPYYTVGHQIAEAYEVHHHGVDKSVVRSLVLDMMTKVGIPNPEKRIDEYPHQFSGGMRQRIVIAIALINQPKVLIADEPTTALDVTVQAQILDLMKSLQLEFNMAIILITHDLGVIAEVADNVLVMYAGRIVETSSVSALFAEPVHPYAFGLLGAVTSLEASDRGQLDTIAGSPPSLISLPSGCSFHPRCEFVEFGNGKCVSVVPELRSIGTLGSSTACHLSDDVIVSLGRKAARA
ncbi:MAG: ATP-binding cassette domain-containing protein [Actinobacteria bacterium]|nr:ATP-binding cassette domain-containing protein [Actinomycetota bacterium]